MGEVGRLDPKKPVMDEFGCFDPKKPVHQRLPDWRTSTYRGHRHITDTRLGNKLHAPFDSSKKGIFVQDKLLHEKKFTEMTDNYVWKYPDPNLLRNPSLNMKMHYMKTLEEGKMRFVRRRIKPMTSISQDTFVYSELPFEPDLLPKKMPTPIERTKVMIDRSKSSYSKYLDPGATTYNLDYVALSLQDLQSSVAVKDTITYWNWSQKKTVNIPVERIPNETMCDNTNEHECAKRRWEFQNQLKRVPHTGLNTEVRSNYSDPRLNKEAIEYNTTDIKPLLVHEAVTPFAKISEYNIIGSGEPVVKYV